METFNPNNDNDHDYSIVVMVENRGFPHDQSVLNFPQVSLAWKVFKSYHISTTGTTGSKSPIREPDTTTYFDAIQWLPSQDIISSMLHDIPIPFQLDRLQWKTQRSVRNTERLNSVDDMISNIRRVVDGMILAGQRKKIDVMVTIEKQVRIPDQHCEAILARRKRREIEDYLKGFYSMLSRDGLLQQPEARDQAASVYVFKSRLANSVWNEIRSFAAAAGLNINRRGGDNTLDVDRLLSELGMLMDSMSLDEQALVFRPKPASKKSVEALDKFIKIDGVQYGCNSEYCVVCLERMLSGVEVTCLPCSHMFHANCIVQWFELGHTCPVCRFKLPTD